MKIPAIRCLNKTLHLKLVSGGGHGIYGDGDQISRVIFDF